MSNKTSAILIWNDGRRETVQVPKPAPPRFVFRRRDYRRTGPSVELRTEFALDPNIGHVSGCPVYTEVSSPFPAPTPEN